VTSSLPRTRSTD